MAPRNRISPTLPNSQLLDESGRLSFPWLKWFQGLQVAGSAFDLQGSLDGPISPTAEIAVRGIALGVLLQHITNVGKLDSLTNVVADVDTDHITDGTGNPLAGGKAAYTALVTSGPLAGQVLEYNGAAWVPATLAAGVASLNTLTGALTLAAGSGVTITPAGSTLTIAASGGGAGYVRGHVTLGPVGGAGTLTGSGTVTGAVVGSAVLVGVDNGTEAANLTNLIGWVSGADTVTIQGTFLGASLALNLPVVVFN